MIEQKPGHFTGAEIAVIGMAGRFPGADKIDQFWENLKNGVESLTFLSDRDLEEAGVSAELIKNPSYVKTGGGVLENKKYFDASFFGYTPLEAQLLNPQIRVFYECAWEALENAAYNPFSGSQLIGIFAGASPSFHWEALAMLSGDVGTVGGFTLPLLTGENNLSTRLAYHLNLKGPAVAVQTACSTSLVAIHMACQALLNGECDMALAGGVSITSQQLNGYLYQAGMVNSPDGHCRAFDARAKGMISGEGCGVVVLKRLEHAVAHGDYIHAVIKGTAINNDGIRKVGYTAPSVAGQAEVIQVTHQVAEVEPESITYLETHGTGTILGDPIEIRALKRAFKTDKKGYCAVGSVKTNIGHLGSAAGVASFIKTVLALKYRLIPPSLHVETPNPEIDFENSPFFVNNRLREWKTNGYPLRAGVSSFGIGGTNAHIILEEWPPEPSPGSWDKDFQLILISAKTPTALERMTENLVDYLKENSGVNLADVAYSLQVGRRSFPCKKMIVLPNSNAEELITELSSADSRKVHTFSSEEGEKQVVFMFCGQGSQYIDMGLELYQKEPLFRQQMDRCFDILRPIMDYDLKEVFLPGIHSTSSDSSPEGKDELIHRQDLSQPMFFTFEFALAQLLMKWGIKPDAMIGYSIGEYVAAHLAGVFSLEDALTLVVLRGKLMQQLPPGVMLSVPIPEEELRPLLNKELSLAAVNEPTCIVAGSNEAIGAFERKLKEKKYMCRRLSISHAGHSVMLDSMLKEFKEEFGPVNLEAPKILYISSLTGRWMTGEEATSPEYWARHLRETVRFSDGIKELMKKAGSVFIEIGPGHDLSALVKRYIDNDSNHGHRHQVVNMIRHRQKEVSDMYYLMSRIGQLWLYGVSIGWNKFYAEKERHRLPLPTYPFERQQYWLEGSLFDIYAKKSSSPAVAEPMLRKKPDMADWFYVPSWQRSMLPEPNHDNDENRSGQNKTDWLVFLDDNGGSNRSFGSLCVERLRQEGHEVRTVKLGREFKKFRQDAYTIDPGEYHDYCRLFDDLYNLEEGKRPKRIVHFWSLSRNCLDRLGPEATKRAQESGFYSILNIGRAIGRQRSSSRYRIDVVSNNIQEVTGDEELAPHKATLLGPLKVIPQEYPNIRCHCIDIVLPPSGGVQEEIIAEQVTEELKACSFDPVIAYRSNFRWLQTFDPVRLEQSPPARMLREGGVYLITGGLGRIGLILAEYLARTVKAKLILTGRSAVPPREEKKIRKLQQLEELGAEVLVMSANTADSRQMKAVIDQAEERFGPINGVIHSSAVLQDQAFNLVEHISKDKCELQFQAKIYGVLVLEELLRDKEFDFCLLMSSIASVLGGLGFAAYAAANLFMDLFVHWCDRTSRGRWLSVNWDGWQVEDADSDEGDPTGVGSTLTRLRMTPEEGQEAFQRIISSTRANHFVQTPGDLHNRIDQWIKLKSVEAEGESAIKPSAPLLARPNLLSTYMAPGNPIEEAMVEIFQSMFGVEPIGIQDDFFELGGDSLKAITAIAVIHRRLNIEMPLSVFFASPTIEKLAEYIENTEGVCYTSIPAVEKKEYYPLSSPQKRLYILQAMNAGNIGYNEMKMVLLEGSLERGKFETTFYRLIERHEVFRTSIRMVDREPMQTVNDKVEFEIEYYESGKGEKINNSTPSIENILKNFVRPFNLARAPFFRVGLVKIGERQHLLMVDMHHIVTDGVSHEIFIRDILAFFAGRELPPLRIQYKDYAEWLNGPRQQAALERWEAYWLHQFQNNIPVLNLPTDYARPPIQSFEGLSVAFWLDKEETRHLMELAAAHDVTLYMVLLTIFDVFLAKVSGQEDVVVGTGVAGRRHSDLLNIMGIFVNTLAIRNYPNLWKTFRQLLKEVKETTLGAFENQEYPFELLVEKVDIARDTSRNPLFDAMLVLQNIDVQIDEKPGTAALSFAPAPAANLEVKPYGYQKRISKFDLTLFVEEINGQLFCHFEYSTKLFKSTTIDWFVIFFKEIAAFAVSNPDQRLREIQKISGERREEIIFRLNKQLREETEALTGTNDTLQQRLDRSFKKYRYSTATECGGRALTYGELDRRSNCVASWLINRRVPPETFIGISVEDRLAFISVMIGILKARSVFVPWEAGYPQRRLELMAGSSGVQLIFTDDHACLGQGLDREVEFILTDTEQLLLSGHLESHPSGREVDLSYSPEDSVYIYFTSGTTGTPRAMKGKNRSLLHFIDWEVHTFGIDESFRFSQLTTPLFDAFLRDIFVPLCTGGVICVPGSKEVMLHSGQLVRWLEQSRIHLMHCVPGLFRLFKSREHLFDSSLKELKYILLSGERLYPTDLVGWYNTVGERIQLVNLWGTSETTLAKTFYFVQPSDVHRERIPVGKPLPGARVVVLDNDLEICDPLVSGQLYIKTPFRTVGYHNEPELNARRFIPDPFSGETEILLHKTGDLGRILPDGNIDVIGRDDRQVKIRGVRVELEEIERVCIKHPLVSEAVVVKREISIDTELLCAYLTSEPGTEGEEELLSRVKVYVSGQLPNYMVPAKFLWVEKIPRKPSGKVDYDALPDPLAVKEPDFQLPQDRVEERLLELWADILGIEKDNISVTRSFFELGGNSLNIMDLISRIHREFDIQISLPEIFNNITIRQQAVIIRTFAVDKYASIKAVEKRDYYPQSSAQKRLFFLDQLDEIGTSYNISNALGLRGGMDKTRYEKSFRALIARHESLRTSFKVIDDEPIQKVHEVEELEFAIEYYAANSREEVDHVMNNFIMPFDLSKAPLLRIGLVGIFTEEHFLVYSMHHIVSDGTSGRILRDEFIRLYNDEALPGLRVQYKDFSVWQNDLFETGQIKKQEEYWLNLYSGEIPRLNLPLDYNRPEVFTFEGARYEFYLEPEDATQLKELCWKKEVTLFMNLLAALNVLLYKYTGQDDIVVGSSFAGRPHNDLQQVIGMFVNELAVRNHLEGERRYEEFLGEVKGICIQAFENQDVQFENLVDKLELQRDPSRNPIFDVCLAVQNFEYLEKVSGEVTIFSHHHENRTSKFDITLFAREGNDSVFFTLEYCRSLFERETVERLAGHFVNVIKEVNKNPEIRLSDINMYTPGERQQLLYDFNATNVNYPRYKTIHELFEQQVDKSPAKTAILFKDACLSYGFLEIRANQLAHYLILKNHVGPDNLVGILMDRCAGLVTVIVGILKAGGGYVPMEPSFPEERIKSIINEAKIGVLISKRNFIRMLYRLQWDCESLHTFLCVDSQGIYLEEEAEKNELMDEKLWEYVGQNATDDITGGGWVNSYTGEAFSREEMDEYGNNIFKKLSPLLHRKMRVLEIGCASGISMYRIAPIVGLYYGTDLSGIIIEKNRKRVEEEGHTNIVLACVPAHQVERIGEKDFDLIILNSVIQSFHGHNYLRRVIGKCVDLLSVQGYLFIGDVMDQDLKGELVRETAAFKQTNRNLGAKTKTDWSAELFVSRSFLEDLMVDFPSIRSVEFSDKIYTIKNELTKFRYDALLKVDKEKAVGDKKREKQKHQHDSSRLKESATDRPAVEVKAGNLAYVIFTSGTTGKPKGVMIEHQSLVNYVVWGIRQYIDGSNDYFPLYTSVSFDLTVTSIFLPIVSGNTIVVYDNNQDRLPIMDVLERGVENVVKATPSHLKILPEMVKHTNPGRKRFIIGGEELETTLAAEIYHHFSRKVEIYNEYGPTEATVGCMIYKYDYVRDRKRGVPIGVPINNVRVYILDRFRNPVPLNAIGELYVGGQALTRGYINQPELTAEKMIDDPFVPGERVYRTGDAARRLRDGRVEFLGRIDDQVKIRGYRIEIKEIENLVLENGDIKDAVVLLLSRKGEMSPVEVAASEGDHYLCCYWTAVEKGISVEESELKEYLSRRLPAYMIPAYFVQMEEIPLTANGKVNRRALPVPGIGEVDESYIGPGNEIESKLVGMWSEILGIKKELIGIDDNFFELGGHSLKATILVSRVHKALNVKVPLVEVFKMATIRGLAEYIAHAIKNIYEDIQPVEKREYYPQSSTQKRLFFLDQFEDIGTSYNMPYILKIRGEMVPERYKKTFKALIARHEALRTFFDLIGNAPVQILRDQVDFEIEMILGHDKDEIITKEYISRVISGFICPFDLSKAPLARAGLLKISEEEYLLLFDMHHIVGDGTSVTILIEDFIQLYMGEELPLLKVQYKDFSMWQNNLIQTGAIREQEEYWLNLYSDTGQIPTLNLPTDYPRKNVFDFEGAIYHFRLNAEDTAAFKELARESGATLYMNLLAAFNVLLHKYSGQDDIIVGTGIAGRPHVDLQNIIGMFVNTLAIRNYPQAEQTYLEFLKEVKNNCVKAFGNQDMQFEELVERISPERTPARNPIFSVELNVQNYERPAPSDQKVKKAANGSIVPYGYERTTSKFDMILFATEVGDEIDFMFEYSTALFKSITIEKMAQRYVQILKQVVAHQAIKIKEIKISHDLIEARPAEIYTEFQL